MSGSSNLVPRTGVDKKGNRYTRMVRVERTPPADPVPVSTAPPVPGGHYELDFDAYHEKLLGRVEDPYESVEARREALEESIGANASGPDLAAALVAEGWAAPDHVEDPSVPAEEAVRDLIVESRIDAVSEGAHDAGYADVTDASVARHLVENGLVRDLVGLRIRGKQETRAAHQFLEGFRGAARELAFTDDGEDADLESLALGEGDAKRLAEDVARFFDANAHELAAYASRRVEDGSAESAEDAYDSAGHDYLLTRNRLGSGFSERGLGDLGDRLDASALRVGALYVSVDADGGAALHSS